MSLQDLRARPLSWWLREVGLTLAAVIGVVCLLSAVASVAFGIKPLVFRSGSMSPAIETGAVGIARQVPADTVRPGDIVSVTNAAGTRITHRVVEVGPGPGGTTTLVLKGDANTQPDAEQYTATHVDLVVIALPGIGYVVAALTHPIAIFLGGAVVGALLMYAFGPRRPPPEEGLDHPDATADDERPGSTDASMTHRAGTICAVVVAGLGMTVAAPPRPAAAAFADTSTAATGSFSTLAKLGVPPNFECNTLGVTGLRFRWTAVSGATSYDLTTTSSTGVVRTTNHTGTSGDRVGLLETGSATVRARRDYPSTTWFSDLSPTRGYTVTVAASTCLV